MNPSRLVTRTHQKPRMSDIEFKTRYRIVIASGIALAVWASLSLSAVNPPPDTATPALRAPAADSMVDVRTRWLSNGLRLVTVIVPWSSDAVSIRLVVNGGSMNSIGSDKFGFHLLEHLFLDDSPSNEDISDSILLRCGSAYAYVFGDHQLHELDVDTSCAASALGAMLYELNGAVLGAAQVDRERERIRHENFCSPGRSPLAGLASEYEPKGALSFYRKTESTFTDTASTVTLQQIFERRYTADNMTMLVAGDAAAVGRLAPLLDEFSQLPTSENRVAPSLGDLPWLSDSLLTESFGRTRVFGLHFPDPTGIPCDIRSVVRSGVIARIGEDTGLIEHSETCFAPNRELWGFYLYWPGEPDAVESYRLIEEILAELAEESARSWWQGYLERKHATNRVIARTPADVLDIITGDIARSDRDEPAPAWMRYVGPPQTDDVFEAYRRIYRTSVTFGTHLDRKRMDLGPIMAAVGADSRGDFWDAVPPFDPYSSGLWGTVTILAGVLTLAIAILLAASLGSMGIERLRHEGLTGSLLRWIGLSTRGDRFYP